MWSDLTMENHYQQYKQQSVLTMTPAELLIMLFDELVKRIKQAELAIEHKKMDAANENIMRAQRIVRYLSQTLNEEYAVSADLDRLYDYFLQQLIQANIKKDIEILRELEPLITDMRDTWKQAARLSKES